MSGLGCPVHYRMVIARATTSGIVTMLSNVESLAAN